MKFTSWWLMGSLTGNHCNAMQFSTVQSFIDMVIMVDMYRYVSCVKKLKWIQVLSAFCQGCVLRVLGLKFLRIDGSIDAKDFGAKQRVRWRDDEDEMKMKSWFKSWFPHARTRSALVCAWEILRVQDLRLGWLFGVLMILSMGLCIITIIWLDILQYIYIYTWPVPILSDFNYWFQHGMTIASWKQNTS